MKIQSAELFRDWLHDKPPMRITLQIDEENKKVLIRLIDVKSYLDKREQGNKDSIDVDYWLIEMPLEESEILVGTIERHANEEG